MKLLLELVERFEGMHRVRSDGLVHAYICPAGHPTQGLGLLVGSLNVPPITTAEARARAIARLPYYVDATLAACPVLRTEPENVLWALSDFTFNLGGAALRGSTLRKRVNARDWPRVATELRRWVNGGGRRLPGLVTRREVEAQIILRAVGLAS